MIYLFFKIMGVRPSYAEPRNTIVNVLIAYSVTGVCAWDSLETAEVSLSRLLV